jgi:ORF6C domain
MSKALMSFGREPSNVEETGVFAIIQSQINASQMMLNEIRQIKHDVVKIETNVATMFQELKDSITINDAERSVLQSIVRGEAYRAAKKYVLGNSAMHAKKGSAEEAQIREMAGFGMRYLWKRLKDKYDVACYHHVRRVDFEEAKRFLEGIHLGSDFELDYEKWVKSRIELKKKRGTND